MELSDVGAALRRHWPIALVLLVLIPPAMALYIVNRDDTRPPDRYSTSADVLIPTRADPESNNNRRESVSVAIPPVLFQGQTELALSPATRNVALQMAGLDPNTTTGITFTARLNSTFSVIQLTVSAPKPDLAADVLEQYVLAYREARRQSVLDAAVQDASYDTELIETLGKRLFAVGGRIAALGLAVPPVVPDGTPVVAPEASLNRGVPLLYERNALINEITRRQVDLSLQATRTLIPQTYSTLVQKRSAARVVPRPPSPLIPLLEILLGGILLALAVPVVVDKLDSTITEARAAPGTLRAGLLGTIPFMPRRLHRGYAPPGSTWDGAFRSLAATAISTDRLPKALMVSAPTGSTQDTVAANFAAALAGLGVTVALVATVPRQDWFLDEDYASSDDDSSDELDPDEAVVPAVAADAVITLPQMLEEARNGTLVGDVRARLATRGLPNLYVIPPGDEEIDLSLDGLPPLLDVLARSEIDVTVIAGPALIEDPNAQIIAWSTRHVLWALEMGRVNARDARLAADRLELAGVEPFGIALVNRHT